MFLAEVGAVDAEIVVVPRSTRRSRDKKSSSGGDREVGMNWQKRGSSTRTVQATIDSIKVLLNSMLTAYGVERGESPGVSCCQISI